MKKTVIAMLALAIGIMAASCKPEEVLRPTSVSVSPSSVSMVEGETTILSVSVQPSEAQFSGISWSSSDTKVATVSNGTVTAVSAGKATISASADGIIGTATVTVTAKIIAVTGVSLDKSELELTEGDEAQLKATVAPDNATDKSVSWKSSDDKIATVSSDGKVTAVAPGEATITVTTTDGNKTATCTVTVKAKTIAVTGVNLNKEELYLIEGDDAQLTATVAPDNATDKNVSWLSSDNAVATVSSEGKVTAVKAGTATIIVTTEDGGKTAICKVTVLANIDGALSGLFSVSDTKKVRFSKGNLQVLFTYSHIRANTYDFSFAEHQYDYVGDAPGNTTFGDKKNGSYLIDLFGWSTESTYYGISTSTSSSDYSGDFRDWGKKIGDGSTWRTLSKDEWTYLFKTTSRMVNAKPCYSIAVSGVEIEGETYKGIFLYPDNYNGEVVSDGSTTWGQINAAGIVFLPAPGLRLGSDVSNVGPGYATCGYYWSSSAWLPSEGDIRFAYNVIFSSTMSDVNPASTDLRLMGYSVRLITDVK